MSHDELDWAPLGFGGDVAFLNLMTSRVEHMGIELGDLAARRITEGEWPWSFFCYPEERPRPVYPSAFCVLAPGDRSLGVAVRCPACAQGLGQPRHARATSTSRSTTTARSGSCHTSSPTTRPGSSRSSSAELYSSGFDARRLSLE